MTDQTNGNGDEQNQQRPEFGCVLIMLPDGQGVRMDVLTPQNGMQRDATHADLVGLVANAANHLQAGTVVSLLRAAQPKVVQAPGGFRFPGRR